MRADASTLLVSVTDAACTIAMPFRRAFERYPSAPDTDQRSLWYAITLEAWFSYHLFALEGTPYEASPSMDRRAA